MLKLHLAVLLVAAVPVGVPLCQAAAPPVVRRDADGEPLPSGAVARLGTLRMFHPGSVDFKAFTPDGRFLITATCDWIVSPGPGEGIFFVWDVSTGRLVRQFGHATGGIRHAVQSPDGRRVVSVGSNGAFLWEVSSGRLVRQVEKAAKPDQDRTHERYVFRDEKTLVALRGHGVETLDLTTGKQVGRARLFEEDIGNSSPGPLLSPDGRTVVRFLFEMIEVLDADTGKVRGRLRVDEASVAFHPGGKVVAVGQGPTKPVQIYDAATLRLLRQWKLREGLLYWPLRDEPSCGFVPGGNLMATLGPNGGIDLWDWTTGAFVRHLGLPRGGPNELTFSYDGKLVASRWLLRIGRVRVFDAGTGKDLLPFEGHHGTVQSLRYADRHTLISTGEWAGPTLTWDLRTGKVARTVPEMQLFDVLSPDGKVIARPDRDGTVLLVESATGETRRLLGVSQPRPRPNLSGFFLAFPPDWEVPPVAFSPDGSVLAYPDPIGPIRLWSVATGEERGRLRRWNERWPVRCLTYSSDGTRLAVGGRDGDGVVEVWDTSKRTLLRRLTVPVRGFGKLGIAPGIEAVAFTADGRGVAAVNSNGPVRLWEVSSGRQLFRSDGKDDDFRACTAVACSPDGRLVATAEGGRPITLWEIASGRVVTRYRPPGEREVKALAFSPDGRTLASAGDDVTILIWEVPEAARRPGR